MKTFEALAGLGKKKDNTVKEKIQYSKVKATIESLCKEYLSNPDDILKIEANKQTVDDVIQYLESKTFLEKYEYSQISPTLYLIKLKEISLF